MGFELDYDEMIILDAEELAEGGIAEGYLAVLPQLRTLIKKTARIEDVLNEDEGSYRVRCEGKEYAIYGPDVDQESDEEINEEQSWGRATYALFSIVNEQLIGTDVRFYAINGGNDLGGLFLKADEVKAAQAALSDRKDWPYLPTDQHPWFGMHH